MEPFLVVVTPAATLKMLTLTMLMKVVIETLVGIDRLVVIFLQFLIH